MQRKRHTLLAAALAAVVAGGVAGGTTLHATATPIPVTSRATPATMAVAPTARVVVDAPALPDAPSPVAPVPARAAAPVDHLLRTVLVVLARLFALITSSLRSLTH